ncbi:MAG: hypothetical protein KatS3mg051_1068 [Anaerolineae bacterium]|nr:MAG: hypothetical protein KatS3mg051_1068 [Anaerolineae bacterium]
MDLQEWARRQVQALIDVGVHPVDAERAVRWVVDNLPDGEDPDQWIPGLALLVALTAESTDAIADARGTWYADEAVPNRYNYILDATPVDDEDEARERAVVVAAAILAYLWVRNRRQYYYARPFGPVAAERIRQLLDGHMSSHENLVAVLAEALHEGRVSPAVWIRQMETALQRLHLQYRALGVGGFNNMGPADFQAINQALAEDFARLREFVRAVRDGELSLLQTQNRARMYVGHARTQFWEGLESQAVPRPGMAIIERRHLTPADHCGDCVTYYEMGWQPRGVLPPPGVASECLSNCRCYKTYREVPAAEVGQWVGTRR